jgi:hypothetical protein
MRWRRFAVEGNTPLNQDGMSCIIAGKPFHHQIEKVAKHCKAIISWGSCAPDQHQNVDDDNTCHECVENKTF